MKRMLVLALAACSGSATVSPTGPEPLPAMPMPGQPAVASGAPAPTTTTIIPGPAGKELRRMVPPEAYLRAYIAWFGGLAPTQIQAKAHPDGLFDTWNDYLAALGLPDYNHDLPRQDQTNTLMLATLGRLGEALCARAAEHDLHARTALPGRVIFRFDATPGLDQAAFGERFDVLHRKFLGYPARLAPADRIAKFYKLYHDVEGRHADGGKLAAHEAAWAAVCTALVQHPEAELY